MKKKPLFFITEQWVLKRRITRWGPLLKPRGFLCWRGKNVQQFCNFFFRKLIYIAYMKYLMPVCKKICGIVLAVFHGTFQWVWVPMFINYNMIDCCFGKESLIRIYYKLFIYHLFFSSISYLQISKRKM